MLFSGAPRLYLPPKLHDEHQSVPILFIFLRTSEFCCCNSYLELTIFSSGVVIVTVQRYLALRRHHYQHRRNVVVQASIAREVISLIVTRLKPFTALVPSQARAEVSQAVDKIFAGTFGASARLTCTVETAACGNMRLFRSALC